MTARLLAPKGGRAEVRGLHVSVHDQTGTAMMDRSTRRAGDPRQNAEAAFKKVTAKPVEAAVAVAPSAIPNARELVSLRIDRDVLEHFQATGRGWQEEMNLALRKAAGLA